MKISSRKLRDLILSQGYTHTRLAKAAGLSRQALQSILTREWAEVRKTTVQGLARALKLPDENFLGEAPLAGYKRLIASAHEHLDFRGLGLPATEPRLLDDLFVPARVRSRAESKHDEGCQSTPAESGADGAEPSLPLEEELGEQAFAECLSRHRRLLLSGEPGSGKTTSLRHVARSYAKGTQDEDGYPNRPLTPIFVRLANYAKARERDGQLSLVQFVLTRVQPGSAPVPTTFWERLLEEELSRGNCLVLLDGLDEVGRADSLSGVLRDFITRYPDNQFVLTSRVVGLETGPWERLDFRTCAITRWQASDIRLFARRWYTARHGEGGERQRKENERRAEELSAAILSQPSLREIATNPLMLTILAALHYANAALPRRRADLYAKVVEVLLETWEAGKREARPGEPLHGILLEAREFDWLLSRLALAMQRQERVLQPRWWVTECVQRFLRDNLALEGEEAKDQGDRVIRHLCERSGLLVERGADVFGFSHRTFQEYLAARGILEEASGGSGDALSLLRPYLYHPNWEEVVRLVGAQLTPAQATALVRTIVDDPDPAGRFLRRGLRLALRCLADGAAVADRRLLDQLFSGGNAIGESKWLGTTLDIVDVLLDLKATRHAADAGKMLADIESAAGQALAAGEVGTLHEAIHGPLGDSPGRDDAPGTVSRKKLNGHDLMIVSVAPRMLGEAPEKWHAAVFRLLRSRRGKAPVKVLLIEAVLRYEAAHSEAVRGVLEELLAHDRSPEVQAACAGALARAAGRHPATANALLRALCEDKSDQVRAACAAALWEVAPQREDVRGRLMDLLNSAAAVGVRGGAVEGLCQVALADRRLLESLVTRADAAQEPPRVRVAALHVLEDALEGDPAVRACLLRCLEDSASPRVQRAAAQIVAGALAEGHLPWLPGSVAQAEGVLMAVKDPCVHALLALARLVAAKEVRGGLRLERLVSAALAPFAQRIALAFIFGSVARREQHQDSDIDLLVVGDIRLKELAGELRTAEQVLGRVINPALYTRTTFRDKYQAGDPFLLDIVRNQKIFLKGDSNELGELVAERLSE
jgi:predicted nucleotidyltransferase/transcriptional regulator with XRE-family HTH domain